MSSFEYTVSHVLIFHLDSFHIRHLLEQDLSAPALPPTFCEAWNRPIKFCGKHRSFWTRTYDTHFSF